MFSIDLDAIEMQIARLQRAAARLRDLESRIGEHGSHLSGMSDDDLICEVVCSLRRIAECDEDIVEMLDDRSKRLSFIRSEYSECEQEVTAMVRSLPDRLEGIGFSSADGTIWNKNCDTDPNGYSAVISNTLVNESWLNALLLNWRSQE